MERSRLAGLCYIAERWHCQRSNRIDYDSGIRAFAEVGARHWRNWMHTGSLLDTPTKPNMEACELHRKMLERARQYDIEVLGMNHNWFVDGDYSRCCAKMPPPGSAAYYRTLDDYEASWRTITQQFPDIMFWEVGNEWNHDIFLKPVEQGKTFSLEEKARIAMDMLYRAYRGIRTVNSKACVVIGGLASLQGLMSESAVGIKQFYTYLFTFSKALPDGYRSCFDIANWHPYFTPLHSWSEALEDWANANRDIYEHIRKLGYQSDHIWLTEFGFPDVTAPPERLHDPAMDEVNAGKITDCFEAIRDCMPFVEVVHYFRLFDDPEDLEWSRNTGLGEAEGYFGLITEKLQWKQKARAFRAFADSLR